MTGLPVNRGACGMPLSLFIIVGRVAPLTRPWLYIIAGRPKSPRGSPPLLPTGIIPVMVRPWRRSATDMNDRPSERSIVDGRVSPLALMPGSTAARCPLTGSLK